MNKENRQKMLIHGGIFLVIMGLTFYAVMHGQNLGQIWESIRKMSPFYLGIAIVTALFFVSAEGCMIWYLLRSLNGRSSLGRCICYSFIGFFYSGITPSATGGQPMQLYHMKKDGNDLSESSVVLMTVALIYKFVLVVIGIGILAFWNAPLKGYLKGYYGLYLLGLALNGILVAALLAVMLAPGVIQGIVGGAERLLVRLRILKKSTQREEKVLRFVDGYQAAVKFLTENKSKVFVVTIFTFLQRASVFFLTAVIYRGFALEGAGFFTIMALQASVYIAVDMLPIPGSQGITELMYQRVFSTIFTGGLLLPSLYVTRGINFYLMLVVSLAVMLFNRIFICRREWLSKRLSQPD